MAIRGIDNQIMVTKSTEVAADRVRAQKDQQGAVAQASQQVQQDAEQAQNRPMAVTQAEQEGIRPDQEGGGQGGEEHASPSQKEAEAPPEKEPDPLLLLPVERGKYAKAEKHRIDIIV